MAENKFDKEKIPTVESDAVPMSFNVWGNETVYNVKEKRSAWWQCPKCGGNVTFDSMDESFDEELGENQFYTVYSWECEECEAHGSVYAAVNPLYISIDQEDDED